MVPQPTGAIGFGVVGGDCRNLCNADSDRSPWRVAIQRELSDATDNGEVADDSVTGARQRDDDRAVSLAPFAVAPNVFEFRNSGVNGISLRRRRAKNLDSVHCDVDLGGVGSNLDVDVDHSIDCRPRSTVDGQ